MAASSGASKDTGAISYSDSGAAAVNLARLDESRGTCDVKVGIEIYRQLSSYCRYSSSSSKQAALDWKAELRTGRIKAQVIYNASNRRQAEQVEAALQEWDLTHNQPPNKQQRFSLHQRWVKNFAAKACEGHVLLVEFTKAFFAAHKNVVFVLKASGNLHVGPDGKVVN